MEDKPFLKVVSAILLCLIILTVGILVRRRTFLNYVHTNKTRSTDYDCEHILSKKDLAIRGKKAWHSQSPCQYLQDIFANMNTSVNACINFHEYSTGRWGKNSSFPFNPPKNNLSVLETLESHIKTEIINIFDIDKNVCALCIAEQKARNYYTSCRNHYTEKTINSSENYALHLVKEFCINETIYYFPDIVSRIYIQSTKSLSENISDINKVYITIKKTFKTWVQNAQWINSAAKDNLLFKMETLSFVMGYPSNILKPNAVDQRYINITIRNDTYWNNIDELETKFKEKLTLEECQVINTNPNFDIEKDRVFLPAAMMRYPIYDVQFPIVLKYARIGFVIAHEMAHAFYKYYSEDITHGKNGLYNPMNCMEKSYPNGNATMEENFADVIGLNLSYTAWRSVVTQEDYQIFPGLKNVTENQLFYIAWAQMFAGNGGQNKKRHNHSSNVYRVEGAVAQSEDFYQIFHCLSDLQLAEGNAKCFS